MSYERLRNNTDKRKQGQTQRLMIKLKDKGIAYSFSHIWFVKHFLKKCRMYVYVFSLNPLLFTKYKSLKNIYDINDNQQRWGNSQKKLTPVVANLGQKAFTK